MPVEEDSDGVILVEELVKKVEVAEVKLPGSEAGEHEVPREAYDAACREE